MNPKQKTQLALYIDERCTTEFAIMFFQFEEQSPVIIWEFSTSLSPHGELATNTNNNFNALFNPKDHFVFKMPWVKTVEKLYSAHLSQISKLIDLDFLPCSLSIENTEHRIVDQVRWSFDLQVRKGRMKKTRKDTYRYTLYGSAMGVPLIAVSMLNPLMKLFVGSRHENSRNRQLMRSAIRARKLPEDFKMYHEVL